MGDDAMSVSLLMSEIITFEVGRLLVTLIKEVMAHNIHCETQSNLVSMSSWNDMVFSAFKLV